MADSTAHPLRGFLVHVFQTRRDRPDVFAIGRLETGETFGVADDRFRPRFYVRESDWPAAREAAGAGGELLDWTTMDGERVARLTFPHAAAARALADALAGRRVRTYEADVPPTRQWLMERGLRGGAVIEGERRPGEGVDWVYVNPSLEPVDWEPDLRVLAFDIETNADASEVWAISLAAWGGGLAEPAEEVLLVGEPRADDPAAARCARDERSLLAEFAARVRAIDPDVLTGWNILDFDLPVLERAFARAGLEFNLGRTRDASWRAEGDARGRSRVVLYGRQALDAMRLVRSSLARYDDYRLDTVARAVLGRGKTLDADEEGGMPEAIARAYREDRAAFAEYCLEDSRLVRDILRKEGLLTLTLRRSLLTGLPLDRAWGSVAAFEFLYMTELHKRRVVAPTRGVDQPERTGAAGGLVLSPRVGLYANVLVFDFKSLYPSIIRTFNIDPWALAQARREQDVIRAPNGAAFSRRPGILPELLERFHAERERAKAEGDALASYTYKILQNSFYGVLGTSKCRFASSEAAGAITAFGQHLLRWTRERLEREGVSVLYGDTDSLFVDAGLPPETPRDAVAARGRELCAWVNARLAEYVAAEWRVESKLELEFEKAYKRFLLPPMRGSDRARAKGYAGLRWTEEGEELEIVGMEAARRDWTRLARELQRELLWRLFRGASEEELEQCVAEWVRALRAGEKDDALIYRKSLRKPVDAYTRTTPPHVKAAKLLARPKGVIHYVMTTRGPQPAGQATAPLDYEHYVRKQVEPIVRTLAQVRPLDVEAALGGEPRLF